MRFFRLIAIIFSMFFIISCNNEPIDSSFNSLDIIPENFLENFGASEQANFIGKIVDENSQPIEGVLINVGNTTDLTDQNGVFSINDASVLERFAYVKAKKEGYIDGSRTLTPKEGVNLVQIMLLNMEPTQVINTGEESTISLPNGTQIVFDGNFTSTIGVPYSGEVSVVVKHLSTEDENINIQMPGTLIGQTTNGNLRVLETYGMLAVELIGSSNQELQIANGSTAQITFPLAANAVNAPQIIPLWHFDEVNGYWKEEGQATLQNNTYVANVTHFSFWNWDFDIPSVYLCINLVDTAGNPLSYLPINLYSPALNSIGTYGYTNGQGLECGLVPINDQMVLVVPNYGCSGANFSTLIGPFSTDQNITVTVSETNIVDTNLIGVFNNCDGNPITNGYVQIDLSFNGQTYVFPILDGSVSLNVNYCSSDTAFTIQSVDLNNNQSSQIISGNFTNPITDLGTELSCENIPDEITALNDGMDGIEVTSSTGATAVVNVFDNDTLGGIGVNVNSVTVTGINLPNGIVLNVDGTVDVNENITTGTYTFEYQICEIVSPDNCDTATVTLFITNTDSTTNVINAVNDGMDGIEVTSSSGATAVVNVFDNDTLNGIGVNANSVTVTGVNLPNGIVLNVDGTVDVNENITTGTYTFEYQICEIASPNNCDTATVTLFITNTDTTTNVINAVNDISDDIEVTSSTGATAVVNVFDNDTLGGIGVNVNSVTVTGINLPNGIVLNVDGTVDVNENITTGTYTFEYQICEIVSPDNCDTATVTLFITNTDSTTNVINAVGDGTDGVSGSVQGITVLNVLDNDTLNGLSISANDVTITSTVEDTSDYFVLNADGTLNLQLDFTPSDLYTFEYTICETANPTNCDTAPINVTVFNQLNAINDALDNIDGTSTTTAILNVLDNDTLNGSNMINYAVAISTTSNDSDYFVLNSDGTVDLVIANVPSGTYTINYQICENFTSTTNCSSASVTLIVN